MCSVGVQLLISEPTLQDGVEAEEGEITYCVTSRSLQGVPLNTQGSV